jgi:hypothetical protein
LAASAGAATTETASSAAEIVFNMVVSSCNGDREVAGQVAGARRSCCDLTIAALNAP